LKGGTGGEWMNILKALHRVLGVNLVRDSGNIKSQLEKLELSAAIKLADASFANSGKQQDIFLAGLELGREAKQKLVYKIKLRTHTLLFIGTEAEVFLKIKPSKTADDTTDSTDEKVVDESVKKLEENLKELA